MSKAADGDTQPRSASFINRQVVSSINSRHTEIFTLSNGEFVDFLSIILTLKSACCIAETFFFTADDVFGPHSNLY